MLKHGILNPHLNSLLARIRHTNALVIADQGFPFWPEVETVDISLVADVPTVLQVINAVLENFTVGKAYMAEEFLAHNSDETRAAYTRALDGVPLAFEPHERRFQGARPPCHRLDPHRRQHAVQQRHPHFRLSAAFPPFL